jgi:hypothetical protein
VETESFVAVTDSAVVGDFVVAAVEVAAVAVVDDGEQYFGFVVGMLPGPLPSCCWLVTECQLLIVLLAGWVDFLKM